VQVPAGSGMTPSRFPSGVNRQRLALLLAVLGKVGVCDAAIGCRAYL